VRVNLVNPGPVRTQMRAKAFPGEDPQTLPAPEDVVPLFLDLASPSCTFNGCVVNFREWQKPKLAVPANANTDE
jgi:NAD(P)-dependent dehydrogenase (short-subunit alcohol dehydrogenase family)